MSQQDSATAHTSDNGFTWFSNAYDYENVDVSGISSGWAPTSGVYDWYTASWLYTNTEPGYLSYYEINYDEGNYGPTGYYGRAFVYSNSGTCMSSSVAPPGDCNKSNHPATTANILLNTYYTDQNFINNKPNVAPHELGHPFGLKHPGETVGSCEGILMDAGVCQPHQGSVTSHDAELVDLLY